MTDMIKLDIIKIIKIVLAILLLSCLLKLSYGYYELVRFAAMVGFGVLGYFSFKLKNSVFGILWFSLAILFNPIIKIALGRNIWNIVDIAVAVILGFSIFVEEKFNTSKIG